MKRTRLAALALAAGATVGAVGVSTSAQAGFSQLEGAQCVIAGVQFLAANGLLDDAALRQIDYSTLADPEDGPIFTELPPGSFVSLRQVIRLHYTNPELFMWCM